jgi:hypothetical protein
MSEYFEDRIDELQQTIDELEETIKALKDKDETSSNGITGGYLLGTAIGTAIAVVLSWSRNASILWCILHGIFSWVYVIYFAITR